MNENDEQILRAIRQRMAGVEAAIPVPPAWNRVEPVSRRVRPVVRSGVRFAIAPLVLVVVVVALAFAGGMANRPVAVSTPTGDYMTVTLRVATTSGAQVTPDELDLASEMVEGQARRYGTPAVSKVGSDQLIVQLPGNFFGQDVNVGLVPQVRFVLLPPALYGTAEAAGKLELPARGASFDQGLPAQYTAADFDPGSVKAEPDSVGGSDVWLLKASLRADKAAEFETWTGQHVNDYFAILAEDKVLSVPYIKAPIVGGSVQISGNFTRTEAEGLAQAVKFTAYGLTFRDVSYAQLLVPDPDGSTVHPAVTQPPMPGVTPGTTDPTPAPLFGMGLMPMPAFTRGTGPVQVYVWLDFKCAGCREFDRDVLPKLIANYADTGKVTLRVLDDTVIDEMNHGHESADAAAAARCAGDQGKYLEYAGVVFANQGGEGDGSLTADKLIALGASLPMDQAAFAACVRAGTHLGEVQAGTAAAHAVGVGGVPAVAVGVQLLPGAVIPTYTDIAAAIDAALGSTSAGATTSAAPSAAVSAAASALPSAAASTAGS